MRLWMAFGCALLILAACSSPPKQSSPQPEVGQRAPTQTVLAAELRGTLTAKAPTATNTPTAPPTETPPPPTQTPTRQPTPTMAEPELLPMLAFVRLAPDQVANVVIRDLSSGEERILTHFSEPLGIFDLNWAPDGTSLVLVSAHNYLASREYERNVFTVKSDGTGLRMITGDVTLPNEATGPFVSITGMVTGTTAPCYVSAQGAASPTTTDIEGAFTLTGVPVTARWVRAVCAAPETPSDAVQDSEAAIPSVPAYQGWISLTDRVSVPLTITLSVSPSGAGWRQASLSPEGDRFCGVRYTWTLSTEGAPDYRTEGVIYDMETHLARPVELPEGAQIQNLTWSPNGDLIAGAYRMAQGSYLALWNTAGRLQETILEIPDTDSVIMTAKQVSWSPDGTRLAYALHQHYWWEDPTYKTEIWTVSLEEPTPQIVTSLRWGEHATHPSWTADGETLYYEFARGATDEPAPLAANYSLRAVAADGTGRPIPLLDGEPAMLPAAHPVCPVGRPKPEDVISAGGP